MRTEIIKCPNCQEVLRQSDKVFRCDNNHAFDLSKEGYLNLLLPNQKKAKLPGDNAEMINNRIGFLTLGYYDKLANTIKESIEKSIENLLHASILDLGCGSGFYLKAVDEKRITKFGLDISKYAISKAARSDKGSFYLVSSFKSLPFVDKSLDVIVNNFAPLDLQEAIRVLNPKGTLIKIVPTGNHMKQLAELIYDEFRPHTTDVVELINDHQDLSITNSNELIYDCNLTGIEAESLIGMTPYFHKYKLLDLKLPKQITVTFSFLIVEIKKNSDA